ncbi:phage tail protein [Luethyella okanaganae]|uniref:Phage tail protein n=1 Tax=Luethyella okanaganae TaxID=69372 RepID=A0ABW1VGJ7_9MICO
MSEPFIGEIRMVSFNYAPKRWALCNGQLLPIAQNQALFSLLGTYYGGNGQTTFALPDLRERIPLHVGAGFIQGQTGGEAAHVLTIDELPSHAHGAVAATTADAISPSNAYWAGPRKPAYGPNPGTPLAAASLASSGGGQPHNNLPPYLVVNFAIALTGIFPSRN